MAAEVCWFTEKNKRQIGYKTKTVSLYTYIGEKHACLNNHYLRQTKA